MLEVIIRTDKEKRLELYFPYELDGYFGTSLTRYESHNSCSHDYILESTKPSNDIKGALSILSSFGYDINQVKFIKKISYSKKLEIWRKNAA